MMHQQVCSKWIAYATCSRVVALSAYHAYFLFLLTDVTYSFVMAINII